MATLTLALALPAAGPAVARPGISLGLTDGSGLVIDGSGRVVVSGPGAGHHAPLVLARRLPGGAPDSAFGAGGLLPVALAEPKRVAVALTAAEREDLGPLISRAQAVADDPASYDDRDFQLLADERERAYQRQTSAAALPPPRPSPASPDP